MSLSVATLSLWDDARPKRDGMVLGDADLKVSTRPEGQFRFSTKAGESVVISGDQAQELARFLLSRTGGEGE